jgi:hypothetical protein
MAKQVPFGRGLRNEPPTQQARFDQSFRRAEQMVARDDSFRTGTDRRASFPNRVQASQGFEDRRISAIREPSGQPRRSVPQRAAKAVGGHLKNLLKMSPAALGATALLQPSSLGDSTRGTPMNSPEEVRRINQERQLRKERAIPQGRGLR